MWVNFARFHTPVTLPEMDAAQLHPQLVRSGADSVVAVEAQDAAGKKIRLRDFAGAGQHAARYWSWLPMKGATAAEFSKKNPSRTSHVKD